MSDLEYMQEALRLAAQGCGQVSPNPLVGSVIVKAGRVIGRGLHRYTAYRHAEVCALSEAGRDARGATLYVNLEPCCHHGRTPPCTDLVIESGISRVVAAMQDPNPLVGGKGFTRLREAGIEVDVGLCEAEARRLNEKFITYITTRRPFVHMKIAMTLDGKIATRERHSRWITGEASRLASQQLRAEYDAILVGVGTVLTDDPKLTLRIEQERHRPLLRVVLDGRLRTPLNAQLFIGAPMQPVLIFADEESASIAHGGAAMLRVRLQEYEARGVEVIFLPGIKGCLSLPQVLEELGRRQVTSLIVEGGAQVNGLFLAERLINKVTCFIAPKLVGGNTAVPAIGGSGFETLAQAIELQDLTIVRRGEDIEITGYPKASSE
ncbi:MAG: bifunctional diaminohydroxyphosphoribosylaminopyrimidine deaminase/5-amino-6-(5-phosphoribosylamino)uracil reductase RibD [Acidobacteriota bacterium]